MVETREHQLLGNTAVGGELAQGVDLAAGPGTDNQVERPPAAPREQAERRNRLTLAFPWVYPGNLAKDSRIPGDPVLGTDEKSRPVRHRRIEVNRIHGIGYDRDAVGSDSHLHQAAPYKIRYRDDPSGIVQAPFRGAGQVAARIRVHVHHRCSPRPTAHPHRRHSIAGPIGRVDDINLFQSGQHGQPCEIRHPLAPGQDRPACPGQSLFGQTEAGPSEMTIRQLGKFCLQQRPILGMTVGNHPDIHAGPNCLT